MTDEMKTPPHICPRCGGHMIASNKPVQWNAERKGYEHIACAVARAA